MRLISKTVLVGAVASACAYAAAGTLTITTVGNYSLESARRSAATGSINVMDGKYGLNGGGTAADSTAKTAAATDGILLQSNVLSKDTTRLTFTSNRTFGSATGHSATITCSANAAANTTATFTIDVNLSTSTSVIYDMTTRGSSLTEDISCTVPNLVYLPSSFATDGAISVGATLTNINSGVTLESIPQTQVASVGSSLTVAVVSVYDAVIDVSANRLTFASGQDPVISITAGGATPAYADVFAVTVTPAATASYATVNGSYNYTFNLTLTAGTDFGFLEEPAGTTGGGSCTVSSGSGQAVGSSQSRLSVATSADCKVMTYASTATAPSAASTFRVSLGRDGSNYTAASATPFAAQAYSYSYNVTNSTNTLISATTGSAGSWSLNGTNVTLQYVPVAADTNLQLHVSNTGSAGTASFTAYNDSSSCSGTLGAVNTGTTSLGTALKQALLGAPITGTTSTCSTTFGASGRAAVVVTTTTPSSTTRVHSGFSKSDGASRQIIVNSTN